MRRQLNETSPEPGRADLANVRYEEREAEGAEAVQRRPKLSCAKVPLSTRMWGARKRNLHQLLQGSGIFADYVFGEWVDRDADATLCDDLECCTAHPGEHVELLGPVSDALYQRIAELTGAEVRAGLWPGYERKTGLIRDVVKYRQQVAHVRGRERGFEHFPLLAVLITWMSR